MSYDQERIARIMRQTDPAMVTRLVGMLPRRTASVPVPAVEAPDTEIESGSVRTAPGSLRIAPDINKLTHGVRGPLVRADQPNLNGALFLVSDLEFGMASLLGAPMVLNHKSASYGWVSDVEIASQADLGTYLDVTGRVWSTRFPELWASIEAGVGDGTAAFSMECYPAAIECGAAGCGLVIKSMSSACSHIATRSAPRRQVEPTFVGASLVLAPERPGWSDARLRYS
jgi:hypothetical protein